MSYDVKTKQAGSLLWRRIRNVTGDYILSNGLRVLTLADHSEILLPMEGRFFVFGPERQTIIETNERQQEEALAQQENRHPRPPQEYRRPAPLRYRFSWWRPWRRVETITEYFDLPSHHCLLLRDKRRLEIPRTAGLEIYLGPERFNNIRQQMEKEAGQKLGI